MSDQRCECGAPTTPPTAAAYKRHVRAKTLPCTPSLADASAYRKLRKASQ